MSNDAKNKKVLMFSVIGGVVVVGAIGAYFLMGGGGGSEPTDTSAVDMQGGPAPGVGMPGSPEGGPGMGQPAAMNQAPMNSGAPGMQTPTVVAHLPGTKVTPLPPADVPVVRISYSPRKDPFTLLPAEVAADKAAQQQALLASLGGFPTIAVYKPKPPHPKTLPLEPQPYRRLAGIIRGEAVAAILEEEGSAMPLIVKPGDKVGPWTVRSIDTEKMVMTREGSIKPTLVTVKLESRPTVMFSGGGGGNMGGGPGPGTGPGGPGGGGRGPGGGRRGGVGGPGGGGGPDL